MNVRCTEAFNVRCTGKAFDIMCMRLVVESLADVADAAMLRPERSQAECSS